MIVLLLAGCTWVSQADINARLAEVDDDADGFTVDVDCNDQSAAVNPDAVEVWYDGVDQDCLGDDDFDQDHDGAGREVDCDDLLATVNPAAEEIPYDGVDNDCASGDELDVDADGSPYPEDCDDADSTSYPGAAEVWYDGIDQDCLGDADDDQDGDGSPFGTDCNDEDPETYPGAPDAWYDGYDTDCAGDADFDQDLDGHDALSGGGDDCDDLAADVNPDSLEAIGDLVDSDCDGTPNGFRLRALPGRTWTGVSSPALVLDGSDVVLSVVATAVDTGAEILYDSASLFALVPSDANLSFSALEGWISNSSDPSGYAIGAAAAYVSYGGDGYGALSLATSGGRSLLLAWWDPDAAVRSSVTIPGSLGSAPFDDVSLYLDASAGTHQALGCDSTEGVLAWARVDTARATSAAATVELTGILASACSFDDQGQLWAAVGGVLTRIDLAEDVDGWYGTAVPVLDGVHAVDLDPFAGGLVGVDGDSETIFSFDGTSVIEVASPVSFARVDVLADGSGGVGIGTDGTPRWVEPDGQATVLTSPIVAADGAAIEAAGYRLVAVTGVDGVAVGYAKLP